MQYLTEYSAPCSRNRTNSKGLYLGLAEHVTASDQVSAHPDLFEKRKETVFKNLVQENKPQEEYGFLKVKLSLVKRALVRASILD